MLEIHVDADACPVKVEVENVAGRHGLHIHIVSNGGIRPRPNPLIHSVIEDDGADAADDWIADHIEAGDIVITAHIPLAARCILRHRVVPDRPVSRR
ncbi:MAG TPA: DUF188 domain-containing protein [Rhizomicrobium sp.]|nr:DUF188 domain-containing protein [Rhizomicrobium sp.]